jgi:hypothetical protein
MRTTDKKILKWFLYKLLILSFVLGKVSISNAQDLAPKVLSYKEEIVLPFNFQQGFIIVDVVLHRKLPLKFILDTGAENTVLFKKQYGDILGFNYSKRISLLGADLSDTIEAYVVNGTYLQLVNCETVQKNIIVLGKNQFILEQFLGTQVDGILGAEFFEGLVLKIDYQRQEITLLNPKKDYSRKIRNYEELPIDIIHKKPYLNCKVAIDPSKETNVKMLLDTGAGLTFMLHTNTDSNFVLPSKVISASLGKGLGGEIMGFWGKVHSLKFSNFTFQNAYCNFQDIKLDTFKQKSIVRNGLIGNLLLERFDIAIDFVASKAFFKAHKQYNKDFSADRSGIILMAYGRELKNYFINDVINGTPGFDAGLQRGDIIKKVGVLPASLLSLQYINSRLSGKAGTKVKLKVQRGDKYLNVTLALRDLI